ncbi:MAG TPA: type II restriction endonuclease [Candidatus Cloacimonadota bacterium]|nr:restriction endonuclease [Bacteroidales bacterium]HNQ62078.1 type II restriction endonuclease [Bacteroidia bacterium]HPM01328.1 type II restriction endonuclease [Candidatus Cloacimonadota bacterium]HQG76115.1 type II restriction endonuclease [Bacteroidales bacterium]
MDSILQNAVQSAQKAEIAFTKFITANDTGTTGGHQSGFHIHKNAWPLFFSKPGEKGSNRDLMVTIKWQNDFITTSRFIYYGVGTRNEYRLTRFGKGFPFLTEDNVGDLLILCKRESENYEAFVLQKDEEIEDFLAALNITVNDTNKIIPKQFELSREDKMYQCFITYLKSLKIDFPVTTELSLNARRCFNNAFEIKLNQVINDPDNILINWLDAEFKLFKTIENDRYAIRINTPFSSVEELVETANTILNRRKSRAGKSLEHHLTEVFSLSQVSFESQVNTEGNKKPDFLFPSQEAYLNPRFNPEKLCVLASKTTCKDRWRQILNEADRIKTKHLFTLQQGISSNQLDEMIKSNVQLVVPRFYISSFPTKYRDQILTLGSFIKYIQTTQT